MRPDPEMIPVLIDTAKALKGSQRRLFMAKTVAAMGRGGQIWAEAHLGWNRETIRKGMHEFRSGMTCVDAFDCRRRYTDAELPTQQTINKKLNLLGFRLTKVAKSRPQKKSSRPTPSLSN